MITKGQTAKYREYIASKEWYELCKRLKAERHNICDRCGHYYPFLEVHHKTYARLGHERDSDLEVLCHDCHIVADYERKQQKADVFEKRMLAWAATCYGPNWKQRMSTDRIRNEYRAFINRRK